MSWGQHQKIVEQDGAEDNRFGESVALDDNTLAIGVSRNYKLTDSGRVYVFVRSGTTWIQQQELVASDGEAGDRFGYSVALDGDTLLIASPLKGAYVFVRSGITWSQQQKLGSGGGCFRGS